MEALLGVDSETVVQITYIDNRHFTPKKNLQDLNSADFIIVDQLYSFRELISFSSFRLSRPNLLIVHDCNTWFNPQIPSRFINKIKQSFTARIKKQFSYFAVAGVNMQQYLQSSLKVQNLAVIPFRYADYDPAADKPDIDYKTNSRIVLAVPGMITDRRRYRELVEALATDELKDKVELVLLGKPKGVYGEQIIQLVKAKIQEGYHIRYWTDFIPGQEFDAEVKRADLLFSEFDPLYYTDNGQKEIYGITKETGISLLMLNKAKPGLLPANFNQMQQIVDQTLHYSNLEDLAEIIDDIYHGKIDLNHLTYRAIENALSMDIQTVANQLRQSYESQA